MSPEYLDLEDADAIMRVARIAAKSAWVLRNEDSMRLYPPDVYQEWVSTALLGIAKAAKYKNPLPTAYAFVAARRECYVFFYRLKSISPHFSYDRLDDPDDEGFDEILPSSLYTISDEHLVQLYEMLLDTRVKKGKRGEDATNRDLFILQAVLNGWSNAEIAKELGLKRDSIDEYRRQLRARLESILESR